MTFVQCNALASSGFRRHIVLLGYCARLSWRGRMLLGKASCAAAIPGIRGPTIRSPRRQPSGRSGGSDNQAQPAFLAVGFHHTDTEGICGQIKPNFADDEQVRLGARRSGARQWLVFPVLAADRDAGLPPENCRQLASHRNRRAKHEWLFDRSGDPEHPTPGIIVEGDSAVRSKLVQAYVLVADQQDCSDPAASKLSQDQRRCLFRWRTDQRRHRACPTSTATVAPHSCRSQQGSPRECSRSERANHEGNCSPMAGPSSGVEASASPLSRAASLLNKLLCQCLVRLE